MAKMTGANGHLPVYEVVVEAVVENEGLKLILNL